MDSIRHFKSFFDLYHKLDTMCNNGFKGSIEANKIIGVMQFHYRNF
jgi:hypothetical protein